MLSAEQRRYIASTIDVGSISSIAANQLRQDTIFVEQEYAAAFGLDPNEVEVWDPEVKQDMESFMLDLARDKVENELEELPDRIETRHGLMVVWRCMSVQKDWHEQEMWDRPLGICWSFDPAFAKAHFGDYGQGSSTEVVIEGLVAVEDVDWAATIELNAVDEYVTGEEREIRLLEEAVVELQTLQFRHEDGIRDLAHLQASLPAGVSAMRMTMI